MGELLRRYWMPVAAEDEFDRNPIKAVRLMGEDLVLYRDMAGTYGLVDRTARTAGPTFPTASSRSPCNWLQCQENSIDPVHFEWMHRNWTDEFDNGFVYKRLVEGMGESQALYFYLTNRAQLPASR
jgi:phenylpropionate dioxygenase-like ring-hydroxylating dioxygenase large terminal subunit